MFPNVYPSYGETGNTKEESYKLGENNYLISYARNNDGTIGGKILYSSKGKISTNWLYDAKSHTVYKYDGRGRMTQATEFTNPTSTFSSTKTKYSYDLNGNRTKTEYGNGLTAEYVYNKAGMLTEMRNNKSGLNIETLKYDYYYDGNIKNETVTGNMRLAYNKTYTYDKIGRLTGENKTGSESININYEYDLNGNRTSMTYDGAGIGNNAFIANYTYDSGNRLLTERKNYTKRNETEITQYTYDDNGNQLNKLTGTSAVYGNNQVSANISNINELSNGEYENRKYNLFNQLTDVSINGKESKYTYRPDGLRLTKTADGKTTGYIWDEGKIYAETNDLFEIQTAYIYGNERINSNNGVYYLYNGHGDVTGLADTAGNITKTYNYDAFGVELNQDSGDTNPFGYCGEYYDKETNNIYLRARYYNPVLGRFTTEDPAKDGLNWYIYCNNNPVNFVDSFGLTPTAMETAEMATHIYDWNKNSDKDKRIVAGWRLIDVWNGREGMKMGIYIRDNDDWQNPSEYVVAFKGTTMTDFGDWQNNIEQLLSSKSADMWDAINYSKKFVSLHSQEITFVGHSKDGAETTAAAIANNKDVMSFNPASLNLSGYGLDTSNYTASSTAYIVKGEIVNNLEGWFSYPIDKVVYLPQQYGGHWYEGWQTSLLQRIQNHLMSSVKSALKEAVY